MTYETFKTLILNQVKEQLAPDASVQLQKIRKNNGLELDGLTISSAKSNLSPTIFLNYYYEKRNRFPDFDAICQDILLTYEHNKSSENIDVSFFTDYARVKQHLAFRLVNFEKNKELLKTVPHVRYLDLAIVYYCHLHLSQQSSAAILIHKKHLKLWHISASELYEQACRQTPLLLPSSFQNMSDVLLETFSGGRPDDTRPQEAPLCPMYVLTNIHKLYGASCMLYPDLLASISEKLHTDLFILPSSIHEIILLPAASRRQSEELADMVAEINQTELAVDEVLSSHVYYYSRAEQALSICS